MSEITAAHLSIHLQDTLRVRDASLSLKKGELVVLLGPNGSGKTTLLRGLLGLNPISSGIVKLGDRNLTVLPALERAKKISYLPQIRPLAWPNTVKDVVALGRYAYGVKSNKLSPLDQNAIKQAIKNCDLEALQNRRADTLSGGESARMHLARAFAAQTPFLIADEPVAALDPRHQFRIMDLMRAYVEAGNSALIVLHDLSLAARYADRLIWMKDGVILKSGSIKTTLTEETIAEVYDVKAIVQKNSIEFLGAQK